MNEIKITSAEHTMRRYFLNELSFFRIDEPALIGFWPPIIQVVLWVMAITGANEGLMLYGVPFLPLVWLITAGLILKTDHMAYPTTCEPLTGEAFDGVMRQVLTQQWKHLAAIFATSCFASLAYLPMYFDPHWLGFLKWDDTLFTFWILVYFYLFFGVKDVFRQKESVLLRPLTLG